MPESKNFYSRNKANSLNTVMTESQSVNFRNKINAFSQIDKELNNNENGNDQNLDNIKVKNGHMRYKSNLEINNQTIIPEQEQLIKININKKLGNSDDKDLNSEKVEEKSLKNGNDMPEVYSKVIIKKNGFNKSNK